MDTFIVLCGSVALCIIMARLITTPLRIINKPLADIAAIILAIGFMLYLAYYNIFGG